MFDPHLPHLQRQLQEVARRSSEVRIQVDPSTVRKLEEVGRQFSQFAQKIATALEEPVRDALRQVDWSKVREVVAAIDQLFNPRAVAAFSTLDLVPSPTMEQEFIDRIVAEFEQATNRDDLIGMVLDHYDENDCERVEQIVDRLVQAPDFQDREAVLKQTLHAHRAGLDAVTTYPLVAMIEGVLVSALVEYVDKPKRDLRLGLLAEYFGEMPIAFTMAVAEHLGRVDGLTCLLNSMEASLYRGSHWGEPEDEGMNETDLNRHRLLHGRAKSGSRLNTIRCLLILDLLADLVPATRHFLEEQKLERGDSLSAGC